MGGLANRFLESALKRGESLSLDAAEKLARLIPEVLPAKATALTQARHAKLIDSLVDSTNTAKINPESTFSNVYGAAHLPSDILERTGVDYSFLGSPEEMAKPAAYGFYRGGSNNLARSNQYRLNTTPEELVRASGNSFHEAVVHAAHNKAESLRGSRYDSNIDGLKQVEGEKQFIHRLSQTDPDKLAAIIDPQDVYSNLPSEILASDLTGKFVQSLRLGTSKDFRANLPQQINDSLISTLSASPKEVAEGGRKIAKNLVLAGATTGGALLANTADVSASPTPPNEVMSNIDKTTQGGSRLNPGTIKNTIVEPILNAAKVVGKGVKDTAIGMYDTAKTAAGVLTGKLPETPENLSKTQEAINFVGGFTPAIGGGQLLDEARNFFMPKLEKVKEGSISYAELTAQGVLK